MINASYINDTNWPCVDVMGPAPPPAENTPGASVRRNSPSSSAPKVRSWSPRASRSSVGEPGCDSKPGMTPRKRPARGVGAQCPPASDLPSALKCRSEPVVCLPPLELEGSTYDRPRPWWACDELQFLIDAVLLPSAGSSLLIHFADILSSREYGPLPPVVRSSGLYSFLILPSLRLARRAANTARHLQL